MDQRALCICFTLAMTTLTMAGPVAAAAVTPQPLASLLAHVIPLVPGSPSSIESALGFSRNPPPTGHDERYAPVDYRTAEGISLHITLTLDEENQQSPKVTRLMATVDDTQCIDAAKIRDDLGAIEKAAWVAIGTDEGWSAIIQGRFVSIVRRTGRCLASVVVDTRRQPRPGRPTQPLRIGPSGRPAPVPMPGR